jgi:hypothetical protein
MTNNKLFDETIFATRRFTLASVPLRRMHRSCLGYSLSGLSILWSDMATPNLSTLLAQVTEIVERAGALLYEECNRPDGLRGQGDKAVIDVEIKDFLRPELLSLLNCDFWGEETGHVLIGHAWCWVVDPNDGTSDFLKGLKGPLYQ